MGLLTAEGRRIARDMQRSQLARRLRQHEWFRGAPSQVVAGFAELLLVSRELRSRIKTEGVMREDGTLNPAVEAFRKYKHTHLPYRIGAKDRPLRPSTLMCERVFEMFPANLAGLPGRR